MAGSKITISTTGGEAILKTLQGVQDRSQDLQPVMEVIGEYLLGSHQDRLDAGISPDGTPFEPLSPTTLSRKTKNQDKVLIENGYLYNLVYQAAHDGLELGSPMGYAAMHQFGGTTSPKSMFPGKDIPARPYLGLSGDDEQAVLDILAEFLMQGSGT